MRAAGAQVCRGLGRVFDPAAAADRGAVLNRQVRRQARPPAALQMGCGSAGHGPRPMPTAFAWRCAPTLMRTPHAPERRRRPARAACPLTNAKSNCAGPRAILSAYPPGYEGDGAAAAVPEYAPAAGLEAAGFGPEGFLRVKARWAAAGGAARAAWEGGCFARCELSAAWRLPRLASRRPHLPRLKRRRAPYRPSPAPPSQRRAGGRATAVPRRAAAAAGAVPLLGRRPQLLQSFPHIRRHLLPPPGPPVFRGGALPAGARVDAGV